MSNFLAPIKTLLDRGIKTKSTYRAALDGIDQYMICLLDNISYDPCGTNNTVQLHRHPTDIRLEAAQKRLEAFATNKEVGLFDFVKHARTTMHEFLEVIKLGFLHELNMVDSGMFNIEISCMLHRSGLENNASEKTRFENQLSHLANLGLFVEKARGLNSYRFKDTDSNRSVIKRILKDRGARLIHIDSFRDEIDKISFMLDPIDLHKFTESPVDYTLPKTDELNEDEMIKMRKLINEIPSSLAFINESPDMLQTCAFVAESSFAEIEEIVGFDGAIFKRVRERHAKERAANMGIREIEKEIGSQFPAEIARDVMSKITATLAYFCMENMHSTTRDLVVDQWGILRVGVKWCAYNRDMRYVYYFDDKYNEPAIPDRDLLGNAFDVVENRIGGIRLIDNEKNRDKIAGLLMPTCGFEIDGISVIRDDCYIEETRFGQDIHQLKNVFVVDSISASTDSLLEILHQHDISGMRKSG